MVCKFLRDHVMVRVHLSYGLEMFRGGGIRIQSQGSRIEGAFNGSEEVASRIDAGLWLLT